jgi:putative SOS response-associated peptidase YedK
MCGRYVSPDESAIEREFNLVRTEWTFPASFNVAPSQNVPVIRNLDGAMKATTMRWGLVPYFAKGVPGKYSTINARLESIETIASFRGPWKRSQRCIVPSAGFYEWHITADGNKRPFYVTCADQAVFGFAGLWDSSKRGDGTVIESFTIVTMPANSLMTEIHNAPDKQRMPAILLNADRHAWLFGTTDEALAVLKAYPSELMAAWPVSTRVNSPKNNDSNLVEADRAMGLGLPPE